VELMVQKLGGEMHILHVIPKIDYYGVPYALPPSRFDDVEAVSERAREKIKKFWKERFGGIKAPLLLITALAEFPGFFLVRVRGFPLCTRS
jgi:hypothetical protein